MIGLNPAFEMIRKHKKVEQETENLVLKLSRGKISQDEMITAFENGISGQYGKFISADSQTLMSWINQFLSGKNKSSNYLESGLLDPEMKVTAHHYPQKAEDWCKEANKCFTAFLNGVQPSNFHPHVYDRMMLDGKIMLNAYKKYLNGIDENAVNRAKQFILKEIFSEYKQKGWASVYLISTV